MDGDHMHARSAECPLLLAGVYFGQLYGMSDHLSFTLGPQGYQVSLPLHICVLVHNISYCSTPLCSKVQSASHSPKVSLLTADPVAASLVWACFPLF